MEVWDRNPDPGGDIVTMVTVISGHTAHSLLGTAKTSMNQRKFMKIPLERVIL